MPEATFSSLFSNKCDSAPSISPKNSAKNTLKMKEACLEFESMFIYYLFKEMRATIPKCGFITGGKAEAYYTSLLDQELAKELSSKGGIGLASLMRGQLGTPGTAIQSAHDHQEQER
jgi:peptidoglycan hydrolase FlgJ